MLLAQGREYASPEEGLFDKANQKPTDDRGKQGLGQQRHQVVELPRHADLEQQQDRRQSQQDANAHAKALEHIDDELTPGEGIAQGLLVVNRKITQQQNKAGYRDQLGRGVDEFVRTFVGQIPDQGIEGVIDQGA